MRFEDVRSLQDYSGMLAAGSIIAWAEECDRSLESASSEEIDAYLLWVEKTDPFYPVYEQRDFKECLKWLGNPEFADDAIELYHSVKNKGWDN